MFLKILELTLYYAYETVVIKEFCMRTVEVLSKTPTRTELATLISSVAKGENLGYLWKSESVILGILEARAFPQLPRDADWNNHLSEKFSLVTKPSVLVVGKVVDIEMVVHVLDIHFVARELTLLSIEQVPN